MLHLPLSRGTHDRVADPLVGRRSDRAMDVFQYATAGLALAVVALLAIVH
jgi:hypothetical protein